MKNFLFLAFVLCITCFAESCRKETQQEIVNPEKELKGISPFATLSTSESTDDRDNNPGCCMSRFVKISQQNGRTIVSFDFRKPDNQSFGKWTIKHLESGQVTSFNDAFGQEVPNCLTLRMDFDLTQFVCVEYPEVGGTFQITYAIYQPYLSGKNGPIFDQLCSSSSSTTYYHAPCM